MPNDKSFRKTNVWKSVLEGVGRQISTDELGDGMADDNNGN